MFKGHPQLNSMIKECYRWYCHAVSVVIIFMHLFVFDHKLDSSKDFAPKLISL